jgi:hypothetical protein
VSTRGQKTATGSRSGRKKAQPIDSDDIDAVDQGEISKNGNPASPNLNNTLDNLLNSPLRQIGLERGKLTVVEEPGRVQPSYTSASKMVISTSKAASIDSFRASFSTVNHFK